MWLRFGQDREEALKLCPRPFHWYVLFDGSPTGKPWGILRVWWFLMGSEKMAQAWREKRGNDEKSNPTTAQFTPQTIDWTETVPRAGEMGGIHGPEKREDGKGVVPFGMTPAQKKFSKWLEGLMVWAGLECSLWQRKMINRAIRRIRKQQRTGTGKQINRP